MKRVLLGLMFALMVPSIAWSQTLTASYVGVATNGPVGNMPCSRTTGSDIQFLLGGLSETVAPSKINIVGMTPTGVGGTWNLPCAIGRSSYWTVAFQRISNTHAALFAGSWNTSNISKYVITLTYPDGTTQTATATSGIVSVGPSMVDSADNVWAINSASQVTVNGVADTKTANVIEIETAIEGGLVYYEDPTGWFSKAKPSDVWQRTADPDTTN
jgi:hypothetical protein